MPAPDNSFDAKAFLQTTPNRPGVYRMLDADDKALYIGKAQNLKKRIGSYYRASGLATKTMALISRTTNMQITVTGSETEALLLEQNLIKSLKPPFNIMFRDDKSYPYIHITSKHQFPSMRFYRGAKPKSGQLFGPYPNVGLVRDSLGMVQKLFQVRQCEDSVFKNRSRPCLQHQIGRCSAPCVNLISKEDYGKDLRHATWFLRGKNQEILSDFQQDMMTASERLDFEQAAKYRNKIRRLTMLQTEQNVDTGQGDVDVVVALCKAGSLCVAVVFVRGGRILDQKTWFPKAPMATDAGGVLSAFLARFYLSDGWAEYSLPKTIVTSEAVADADMIAEALRAISGHKIQIVHRAREQRLRWRQMALANAEQALIAHLAKNKNIQARFRALQKGLALASLPQHIECFDISHTSGTEVVASCVVFGIAGPVKSAYRKFNISGITPGDDYAAMRQVLRRRYRHLQADSSNMPELVIVDGGKGQINQAKQVFAELGLTDIQLLGIAKGEGRKPKLDKLIHGKDMRSIEAKIGAAALYLIQQIRDEAHRFAIVGHRKRLGKKMQHSSLHEIAGIGAKRRRMLLQHFGGISAIKNAGIGELAKTPGISLKSATAVYDKLHAD